MGDGPERDALEQLAAASPCSGKYALPAPSAQPEEWLRKMNIFALSSDTEQMPLSVLEAMASGLPVVSTAVGDVAQMVSPGKRRTGGAPAGIQFERALQRVIDDPVARAGNRPAQCRSRANELFDEEVMAARYARIIG